MFAQIYKKEKREELKVLSKIYKYFKHKSIGPYVEKSSYPYLYQLIGKYMAQTMVC